MDYLRSDGQLVMREATHNVKKKQAEYFTILLFVASQATPVL